MFFEPASGHGLPHNPFKAIVAPRPIGWISTRDRDGVANLAPYSFFNAVSDTPPVVMFSSGGRKDSIQIAERTGEFVCNFVGEKLVAAMNQTSFAYGRGVSEFGASGLAEAGCRIVKAPRVADAPASLECVVTEIRAVRGRDGETGNLMCFGEVVGVHIDDAMLTDGLFDLAKAKPVTRLGYLDYGLDPQIVSIARPVRG
ncbi:flavin reductase family protein [Oricola thermophila]|uniref:Flavin reductase family protein n=1 Tax=Oricola thermophila TaxID=2742145 RepID=A0A6N1VA21_9HYPH|nr:flavin reductase family protein [Oricola thermophila]QKV17780.1 flavin reductase family protein [Oricola thermophila]